MVAPPHRENRQRAARQAAAEVYVHCFPLLLTDVVRRAHPLAEHQFLLVKDAAPDLAPGLDEDEDERLVLFSAWIELSAGPVVTRLPRTDGRYFSLTLVDTAGAPCASIGSRSLDDCGANLALVGPHWDGVLPDGLTARRVPCGSVWAQARLYAHSTLDRRRALELAPQRSLSALGPKPLRSRRSPATLEIPTPSSLRQVSAIDPATMLHRLGALMERAPRAWRRANAAAVRAARARIEGEPADWDTDQLRAMSDGIADGLASIRDAAAAQAADGRLHSSGEGNELASALELAARAYCRLGAPEPDDVMTLVFDRDAAGRPLTGGQAYRIRFRGDAPPPSQAQWRLSTQPPPGPGLRRSLGDRSDVSVEPDGSLLVCVQSAPPQPARLLNWLPSPKGGFRLLLRLFAPGPAATSGAWRMPAIEGVPGERVQSGAG